MPTEIEELRRWIAAYDDAARKFIDKVDTGRAHSIETYRDLKLCLERAGESSAWQ